MIDLRKTLIAGGSLVLLIIMVLVALRIHDNGVRARERIKELTDSLDRRTAQLVGTQKAKTDTVRMTRIETDSRVVQKLKTVSAAYDRLRASIDTAHSAQPAGTPEGMVLVPVAMIVASDSLRATSDSLVQRLRVERAAADARFAVDDSLIATQRAELAQLRIAARLAKGSALKPWLHRLEGAGVMYALIRVTKN